MSKQPRNPANPDDLADLIEGRGNRDASRPSTQDRHFGIRIDRDGTWYYQGSPINRKPLCKLFSTVLRRDEDGGFWLVTPVERGRIDVDDAPFVAVEVTAEGAGPSATLSFRTNLDDAVTADADHPIRVTHDPETEEPAPYILIRDNLDALISRSVFYELAEMAEEREVNGVPVLGVWSAGEFFALGRPE